VIIYQDDKIGFVRDCFKRDVEEVLLTAYTARTGRRVGRSEKESWRNSLMYMAKVLDDAAVPDDCGVALEYGIPQSSNRIDVLLTGYALDETPKVVIVELKQWSSAKSTRKDGVVVTRFGRRDQETSHPSYQVWSYATLLEDFNEAVHEGSLRLQPCAYLHNYEADGQIDSPFYSQYITDAPLFFKGEDGRAKLRAFIATHLRSGDQKRGIYVLENGRIRPSKGLVDALAGMLEGKREFVLIDDQKVMYESALAAADAATSKKQVVIIKGGPGTGKSVVAVNLLVELTKRNKVCRYVSKNAAPREVYKDKLSGSMKTKRINALFSGSGVFIEADFNSFDALIVDEAHRLNAKSGLYQNRGNNQIKELIEASRCTIFFIDEDQRVTLKDIGRVEDIEYWAKKLKANIVYKNDAQEPYELISQFRCGGSDGYMAWLDDVLDVRSTANTTLEEIPFDFAVMDGPNEVRDWVREQNKASNRARMVAGYCWKWRSKRNPNEFDVVMPEYEFQMRWNLGSDGSLWMVAPTSVEEIGCIHTSQGLEVDAIGVIIGPDLVVRDGKVVTRPEFRASSDRSIHGWRQLVAGDPKGAERVDRVIKNTYRTLMTRGMRACRVFCTDPETNEYFRERAQLPNQRS
jgi:uncharacterized protein